MSVVVYRDGVLAADTRGIHEEAGIMRCGKLLRKRIGRRDHLLGFVGDVSYATLYCDWYGSKQPMPEQLRNIPEEKKFSVLIVIGKQLYEADGVGRPLEIEAKFHAIGAGAYIALGAMHQGATAIQAVKIACKIESSCGLPVQSITLPTRVRGVHV